MAEQTSQEPTMEEILASIRRIISEDEAPEGEPKTAAPHGDEPPTTAEAEPEREPEPEPPQAEPEARPAPPPEPVQASAVAEGGDEEDEPLELTQKVETHGDLDVYTPPPSATPPSATPPSAAPPPLAAPTAKAEPLVSDRAAQAAAFAFDRLAASVAMPPEGRTLEDVVRELLRPMLQQWLDDHLAAIVQTAVEAEVSRIAHRRVG